MRDSRGPTVRGRWRRPATAAALLLAGLTALAAVRYGPRPAPTTVAQTPSRPEPPAGDPFASIAEFPLNDLSGVVGSRRHQGVVWAIRDGGVDDRRALYAFHVQNGAVLPFPSGELFRRIPVAGAEDIDWEDITVDDDGHLYIADIGNNGHMRTDLTVHMVPEPDPFDDTGVSVSASYPFRWPVGSPDAESLFWSGGSLYLIPKRTPPAPQLVYRLPTVDNGLVTTLVEVAQLTEPPGGLDSQERIAGASIRADGSRLAIVTDYRTYVYAAVPGGTGDALVAALVSSPPAWSIPHRPNGVPEQVEGVAFSDGRNLVTASELRGQIRYVSAAAYERAEFSRGSE